MISSFADLVPEWELILNRAGVVYDDEETGTLIICPKHRFKLTTLYKVKVL